MTGDVIETALSDAIRASDYGDQATQEGLTNFYDRAARAALSVVRDELKDEALREAIHSAVWNSPVAEIPAAAVTAIATHFGGAK